MIKYVIVILLFVFSSGLLAQDDMIRVIGDSLVGKTINEENIREVHGNVIMTQGKVTITCNKAIQYIAKNEAELIGNVVVVQDSIIIKTDLGYYYGNPKIAFSNSGINYTDGHVKLLAKNGYYYFDEKKAYFYEDVFLNDSTSNLSSDKLTYYDDSDKAVAVGKVTIKDTVSIVKADSLIHQRGDLKSFAYNNVNVIDPKNNLLIAGDYLESDRDSNYSKILGDPLLIKIDTTDSGTLDTLVIASRMMEVYSDSTKRMIATDSVKIVRGDISSNNSYTIYFQRDQKLFTYKRENDLSPPVLWNENTQLIGDTVNIYLEDSRLKQMLINSNGLIVTDNSSFPYRYDQISGNNIKMLFGEKGLESTEVKGNVLSIYYLYEEGEPNGLLKSSSEDAKLFFKDNAVEDVRLYGSPVSEFHPENIIDGKEKDFTLPTFIIVKNKPEKDKLLFDKEILLKTLMEYVSENGK